jgi:amidase
MKPSRGRVSAMPEGEHWLGLSTRGGLARTVKDSALLLDVIQGPVDGDTDRVSPYPDGYLAAAGSPPGRLRIAVTTKSPPGVIARLSEDQRRAWEQTASLLRELGHEVVERNPSWGTVAPQFSQTWLRGIYEDSLTVPERSQLEQTTRRVAAAGRLVGTRRAQKLRGELRARTSARILALWEEVDVLMTPGLASTALPAEGGYGRGALHAFNLASRFTPWTPPFNLTGQPAVTLPAGFGSDRLPLSVQLVGRPEAEHTLFSLAAQIEAARPWVDDRPPLAADAPPASESASDSA